MDDWKGGILGHWQGVEILLLSVSFLGLIASWLGSGTVFVNSPKRKRLVLWGIGGGVLLGIVLCLIDDSDGDSLGVGATLLLFSLIALGFELALTLKNGSWFSFFLVGGILGVVGENLVPDPFPWSENVWRGLFPDFLPIFWGGSRLLVGRKKGAIPGARLLIKTILFLQIQSIGIVCALFLLGWRL